MALSYIQLLPLSQVVTTTGGSTCLIWQNQMPDALPVAATKTSCVGKRISDYLLVKWMGYPLHYGERKKMSWLCYLLKMCISSVLGEKLFWGNSHWELNDTIAADNLTIYTALCVIPLYARVSKLWSLSEATLCCHSHPAELLFPRRVRPLI